MMQEDGNAQQPRQSSWEEEAAKAISYLRNHPGSTAAQIARSIGTMPRRLPWVLSHLIESGDVIKAKKYNRSAKYYLPGQEIRREDTDNHEKDSEILQVAEQLVRAKKKGASVRSKDIQYAMQSQGLETPNNLKISRVLLANGYEIEPGRSRYNRAYIQAQGLKD